MRDAKRNFATGVEYLTEALRGRGAHTSWDTCKYKKLPVCCTLQTGERASSVRLPCVNLSDAFLFFFWGFCLFKLR